MLTTILTMLGGGLGGLLRFIPEIFKLFTDKRDREHELAMTRLQLEIDQARAQQGIDLVHAQGDVALQQGDADAYLEAIKTQGRPSGVAWVDALSASVRPVIAYWWLALFTAAKVSTVVMAVGEYSTLQAFTAAVWTEDDAGMMSLIIGFWYCDRVIRKQQGI